MPPFVPFGPAHLGALALTLFGAAGAAFAARQGGRTTALAVRLTLAALLAAAGALEIGRGVAEGWLTLEAALPLQLCDAALILAVVALLWPRRILAEVLYFWTVGGSALAMASPDLAVGYPSWEFAVFFALHGLVIAAAAILVFGLGLVPRRGSALRIFAATNAYAAGVALVNLGLGTNFLYLCAKPSSRTLLDLFGPWPYYILAADALALGVFLLLELPFRMEGLASRASAAPASPSN